MFRKSNKARSGKGSFPFLCSSSRTDDEDETPYQSPLSRSALPPKKRELDVNDLLVDNNDMQFHSQTRAYSGGLNSNVFPATHIPSGARYITKQMFSGGYNMSYLSAKREVFSYDLSETLSLGLVPHTALLKKNPKIIRMGGEKIEDYNLPRGRGSEYVISRVVTANDDQKLIKAYDRKKSPLYVFDYLLGQRDRKDRAEIDSSGRYRLNNVLFDKSGKINAIDHSLIFEPMEKTGLRLTPDVVEIFMSNPDTVDAIRNTDWNIFFEKHFKDVTEKESLYTFDKYQDEKTQFINRINEVEEIYRLSGKSSE